MTERYKSDLYTPGRQSLGAPEIVRDNQEIRDKYNSLQARRRELMTRLQAVSGKQRELLINLGAWVAEGCDYKEYTDQLSDLGAEQEALQAGIDYLDGQLGLLKRVNSWL